MGYCIDLQDADFFIAAEKVPEAVKALKAMPDAHYAWVGDFQKLDTLEKIMNEWRYPVEFDGEGNVTGIAFTGEKIGDEETLFEVLAPFVQEGCFIEMSGEDGARWRWKFDGKDMQEISADIHWEDEIKGRQFIVVFGEGGSHHFEDETSLGMAVTIPGMDPNYFKPGTVIRIEDCEE